MRDSFIRSRGSATRAGKCCGCIGIALFALAPLFAGAHAAAAQEEDPTADLIKGAVADAERILEERKTWVGRPDPTQFKPRERAVTFPVLDEESAVKDATAEVDLLRQELAERIDHGFPPRLATVEHRWRRRMEHTGDAIAILHLEFQQIQDQLRDRRRREFNDVDDATAARRLGGEEQAALRTLMRRRIRGLDQLAAEKQRLADEIAAAYGTGEDAHALWLKRVQHNIGGAKPYLVGSIDVQLIYHVPKEDDFYGVEFERRDPDGGYAASVRVHQLKHTGFIEPREPFAEPKPLPEPELRFRTEFDAYLPNRPISVMLSGKSSLFDNPMLGYHRILLVPAESLDHPSPITSIEVADAELRRRDPNSREIENPSESEPFVIDGDRVRRIELSDSDIPVDAREHAEQWEIEGLPLGDYEARLVYVSVSPLDRREFEVLARHPFKVVDELDQDSPKIRFLAIGSSGLREVETLAVGMPVIAEVVFDEPRETPTCEIRFRAGLDILSLEAVQVDGDPRRYRTEAFLPWWGDDGIGLPPPLPGELRRSRDNDGTSE